LLLLLHLHHGTRLHPLSHLLLHLLHQVELDDVGNEGRLAALPALAAAANLRAPTLIIVGEDDPGTPVSASRAMHERIAGSKLVIIPAAMHLCNIERTDVFNSALAGFLPSAG